MTTSRVIRRGGLAAEAAGVLFAGGDRTPRTARLSRPASVRAWSRPTWGNCLCSAAPSWGSCWASCWVSRRRLSGYSSGAPAPGGLDDLRFPAEPGITGGGRRAAAAPGVHGLARACWRRPKGVAVGHLFGRPPPRSTPGLPRPPDLRPFAPTPTDKVTEVVNKATSPYPDRTRGRPKGRIAEGSRPKNNTNVGTEACRWGRGGEDVGSQCSRPRR